MATTATAYPQIAIDWPHDLWTLRFSDASPDAPDAGDISDSPASPSFDGFHRSWIMLFREGMYPHQEYGEVDLSREVLSEIKANFDSGARGIEIALDEEHDAKKATGWIECLEYRTAVGTLQPAGLWAYVRWTPYGLRMLKEQIYRYISPEFRREWKNPISGTTYQNVLVGGALTNRPFLQMDAIQLSTRLSSSGVSTRAWGSVDKACLPDSAFLDPKNRRLPIYEGTGPKDAKGRYTKRGKLNIHGATAALAAIHGARSGKAMSGLPAGTEARLKRLIAAHGGGSSVSADDDSGDGSESMTESMSEGDVVAYGRAGTGMARAGTARGSSKVARDGGKSRNFMPDDDVNDGLNDAAELDEGDDSDGESYDDDSGGDDAEMDEGDSSDSESYDDGDDESMDDDSADSGDSTTMKGRRRGRKLSGKRLSSKRMSARGGGSGGGRRMSTKKMSESGGGAVVEGAEAYLLREQLRDFQRQLTEQRQMNQSLSLKLYERAVDEQIATWGGETAAASKAFTDQYRGFMLSDGLRLSESVRGKITSLVEAAFNSVVDLSQNAASFDMETRVSKPSDGDRVVDHANRLALSDARNTAKKDMFTLSQGTAEERGLARELLNRAFKESGADLKKIQLVSK